MQSLHKSPTDNPSNAKDAQKTPIIIQIMGTCQQICNCDSAEAPDKPSIEPPPLKPTVFHAAVRGHFSRLALRSLQAEPPVRVTVRGEVLWPVVSSEYEWVEDRVYEQMGTYTGQMKNGKREGLGIQTWTNNSKYEGFWKNDKANGLGRLVHSGDEFYEGEWENDMIHGFGEYTSPNGARYIGQWRFDKQDGKGTEVVYEVRGDPKSAN